MNKFLYKIFGDPNKKHLKQLQGIVEQVNSFEATLKDLSDQDLKAKTEYFKQQLAEGKTLDDILPEAFAVVREASKRVLGMRHYDVQLIGGKVLHDGEIAEMKTGEGKTLVATLPLYLNALSGKGAHLVTVNDYLSQRDCGWMAPLYDFLGMSAGVIVHDKAFVYDAEYINEQHHDLRLQHLREVERKEAYQADITYGTNNEFGFDYLRDNMAPTVDRIVQRDLNFAIVDEVDSILIDEARTPLIISAPDTESTNKYMQFATLVRQLKEEEHYNIDEKMRAATLTDEGIARMEQLLGVDNIYTERGIADVHHIEQALRAHAIYKKDKDYVVNDNEIIIIDEFTGRMMHGRRFGEGLHQAIEAKEGVAIQRESKTLATITFQNLFRLYDKLAGMTGTAETEAEEFAKIYGLDVTVIPTNKPIARQDLSDRIYKNEKGKYQAVVAEVKERHAKGQPILVGTVSIDKNEELAALLEKEGIPVKMLNAKNHEREAEIIAQAGAVGAVTVATNMAGRGVDIKLGGDPVDKEAEQKVIELGGLCIIGTERHESRRIDNQLRGRAGRQGDPGVTQFYVSLDDDLMRIFPSERMRAVMDRLKVPEDMPIENGIVSRALESAQKRVEGYHFDSRKHLVEFDDVINRHREFMYRRRREILKDEEFEKSKDQVLEMVRNEIESVVRFHAADEDEQVWDIKEIYEVVDTIVSLPESVRLQLEEIRKQAGDDLKDQDSRTMLVGYLYELAVKQYNDIEEQVAAVTQDEHAMRKIERSLQLRSIDTLWVEHLETMQHLRTGIGLRGYGQRDPLVEYKKEAHGIFQRLLDAIQKQVVYGVFKIGVASNIAPGIMQQQQPSGMTFQAPAKTGQQSGFAGIAKSQTQQDQEKELARREQKLTESAQTHYNGERVGRNDLCPCGSGKKFKKCHGA